TTFCVKNIARCASPSSDGNTRPYFSVKYISAPNTDSTVQVMTPRCLPLSLATHERRQMPFCLSRDLAPLRGRAASRGGIHHASDAFTTVREIVRVRPAAVALVEHRAPDVVGILRTSARTHPCSAGVDDGNLRSLRHFVVRRRAQDVTRARIGLLAQL